MFPERFQQRLHRLIKAVGQIPGLTGEDQYDGGEFDESLSTVIGELNAPRPEGYRTHAPHGQRGTHAQGHDSPRTVSARDEKRSDSTNFGAGIL